jgi:hypothetical protein
MHHASAMPVSLFFMEIVYPLPILYQLRRPIFLSRLTQQGRPTQGHPTLSAAINVF